MGVDRAQWWRDAVVYQIYPRSFQDSDGDGVGDLPGIASRLDHLEWLGVDALWLSPIFPSPGADLGYDVSDYVGVDPLFGSLADLDALIAESHRRGLRVLLDLVASHTSIEHPWFREHPDWYVWADGDEPPNNWLASFGGSAWSRDERTGRWYLHSFYPEQPDLDWRNPEVREAIADVVRFWRERGIDGFRLDAIERAMKDRELRDDPPASGAPALPVPPELAAIEQTRSRNDPEISLVLGAIREAAGDALLVGEVYLPTAGLGPYLEHLDLAFGFELLHSRWDAEALRAVIAEASAVGGVAWVLSNHDFPRLAYAAGRARGPRGRRAAADAPGARVRLPGRRDRDGRRRRGASRPSIASAAMPTATRCSGTPRRQAASRRASRGSSPRTRRCATSPTSGATPRRSSRLYRELIALRRELTGELRLLDAEPGVVALRARRASDRRQRGRATGAPARARRGRA